MEELIVNIDPNELKDDAYRIFYHFSGLDKKFNEKLLKKYEAIYDSILFPSLKIESIVIKQDEVSVDSSNIIVQGHKFFSPVLEHLPWDQILSIYTIATSLGASIYDSDSSLFNRFYTDLWGSSYISATFNYVKDMIKKREGDYFVSECIAPGYYGMDTINLHEIFKINGAEKIGLRLEGNSMVPAKSITGFYLIFKSKPESDILENRCDFCESSGIGCLYCKFNKVI